MERDLKLKMRVGVDTDPNSYFTAVVSAIGAEVESTDAVVVSD
jgi:hypothetical protein